MGEELDAVVVWVGNEDLVLMWMEADGGTLQDAKLTIFDAI